MRYVVVNPIGASGRAWEMWKKLRPVFDEYGGYKLCRSTKKMGIEEICRRITSQGIPSEIIVIGGDGTFNEAVNGIADFENTKFGFIPCGTGNDIGRDMGLPKDPAKLVRTMMDGEIKRTSDIGELTIYGEDRTIHRRFNISSDVGFGAATCAYVQRSRLKPIFNRIGLGRLTYLIEAVRVCFSSDTVDVRITCGKRSKVYRKCLCAIVMNHGYEGGGFNFCPNADPDDGLFDICIGSGLSHIEFLRMLPMAYMGKHLSLRGIVSERADSVVMEASRPVWVHTDGEVHGEFKKVSMKILPQKLKLLL